MNTTPSPPGTAPRRTLLIAAFAAVYVIWGSTYLAIRVGVETLPPFLLAGLRFLLAGVGLMTVVKLRRTPWPTRVQWRNSAIVGTLMLLGGSGLVVWAEQRVSSSLAALFIASTPVWFAVIDWLRPGGRRPAATVWLGVALGTAGVALLVLGGASAGGAGPMIETEGAVALLGATICWAGGSMFAKYSERPASLWMAAAAQMVTGGSVMLVVALAGGEFGRFDPAAVSARSLAAFAYLVVFGSWIGFSAYVWLLEVSTPARVSTYAYVNPVIAVFLGWALLGEAITPRMFLAAAVIVAAVVIITWPRKAEPVTPAEPSDRSPGVADVAVPQRGATKATASLPFRKPALHVRPEIRLGTKR